MVPVCFNFISNNFSKRYKLLSFVKVTTRLKYRNLRTVAGLRFIHTESLNNKLKILEIPL